VWVDANGDGTTDAGELHNLMQLNIHEISLNTSVQHVAQNGNVLGNASTFATTDGQQHDVADVWLQVNVSEVLPLQLDVASVKDAMLMDLRGNGDNTVKLNLTDLLQTSTRSATPVQVNGDACDVLELFTEGHEPVQSTVAMNDRLYTGYDLDANGSVDLMVDQMVRVSLA
jgi:hypothetical protein